MALGQEKAPLLDGAGLSKSPREMDLTEDYLAENLKTKRPRAGRVP
jgi:hypothetical protein